MDLNLRSIAHVTIQRGIGDMTREFELRILERDLNGLIISKLVDIGSVLTFECHPSTYEDLVIITR